ncbi:MAG: pectate lyase [Deltaproteobacteria bacterium]|nr:pectate lyase [Deltaproteobacteria bacterium]
MAAKLPPPGPMIASTCFIATALLALASACDETWLYPIRALDASVPNDSSANDSTPNDLTIDGRLDDIPVTDGSIPDSFPRDVPIIPVCPPAKQIGYSTVGGSPLPAATTGGEGGAVVRASSAADLAMYASQTAKLIIQIEGTISVVDQVRVKSDKTIEGVRPGDGLVGGGLNLTDIENIVVRRLTIGNARATDAVSINNSRRIWIDHCEFYSNLFDVKGTYDGLVDITHGSEWITLSWNIFRDHYNTSVVGHSNAAIAVTEDTGRLKVTYHHNWFSRTPNNNPRVRFGSVHVFNNLYEYDVAFPGTAIVSQQGAQVLVEANTFKNVPRPITTFYEDPIEGTAWAKDNVYIASGDNDIRMTRQWTPPYDYLAESPTDAEALVKACSGPAH